MHPGEVASIHCLSPSNMPSLGAHYDMAQNNVNPYQFSSSLLDPHSMYQMQSMLFVQNFSYQNPCLSTKISKLNSEEEHQHSLAEERKKRRMISNRESAKRSRMRRQSHLSELQSQVMYFLSSNRQLLDELNRVMREHDQILHENVQLKDATAKLQKKLDNLPAEQTPKDSEKPCSSHR